MKTIFALSIITLLILFNSASLTETAASGSIELQQEAPKPSPREGHCLVYDEQLRRAILLDGYQPPNLPKLGEVWVWDGKRWEMIEGTGPAVRSLSGADYDSRRKKIVLYGGVGSSGYEDLKNDTWEWDGKSWQQMADTSVGTRDHHVMAYDAARGKTVMYGGQTSERSWAKDTWEWDGAKWTKITTPGPGGRVHFAMVYDSKRQQVVLFGGLGEDRNYHNDTWTWDGKVWRKVSDEGPPPRARHRMAFDSRDGVIILYGGDGVKTTSGMGFRVLDDMWSWDGERWTEIKTTNPGKRFMHAMAYDAARGKTILFGGGNGQTQFNDTWEWDGKQWSQIN